MKLVDKLSDPYIYRLAGYNGGFGRPACKEALLNEPCVRPEDLSPPVSE